LFHVAAFSWVGQRKMTVAAKQDYAANHAMWLLKQKQAAKKAKERFKQAESGAKQDKKPYLPVDAAVAENKDKMTGGGGGSYVAWGDVVHFVILPNYKEDPDILREAMDSCAQSSLAATQMGFVLAMEAREPNVETKANELIAEYKHKFKVIFATYHPPGLRNEMPGKASNTRWAAQRLWDFMETEGLHPDR
jgi:hypothetical protein